MKVSFIGLGTMGYPMAGHLQTNGLATTVFNRSVEKAQRWASEYDGEFKATPKEACQDADIVMICVGNDNDLREVCYGENGIIAGLKKGTIVIDHTTTSVEVAVEIAAACQIKGNEFLDAPVSGGEIGAQNGQLTIMIGGKNSVLTQVKGVLNLYAKKIELLGPVGSGQTCKMINQLCIAGILQGLSEGLTLAKKSNLDLIQVRDVLKHGAAQSWQLEQRTSTIAEDYFDLGFAIDWMRKDLGICLEQGKKLGINLPLAQMVDEAYEKLQHQGYNRCDTSVLIKSLES